MISRPIKEGFRGVARHWGMSISSAIAVTITLTIISLFLVFTYNVANFTNSVESELMIYASVESDYDTPEQEESMRQQIASISGVKSVDFKSKDQELEKLISIESDTVSKAFTRYRDDNPLYSAFYVKTTDGNLIPDIQSQIEQIPGIYEVNSGGQSTQAMMSVIDVIRRVGTIVVVILTLLAVFLIQNTIKLTISAREDEITIMRNVGATNHFIRSPFVIEGVITGVMGSIIPIAATIYAYQFMYQYSDGILVSKLFKLVNPVPFVYELSGVLLLIGVVVGFVGSWLSVTKYLRWKR